ncbi:MAG: molybdopterin cofactor-binding domain-containing protein, partial [Tardiphaga sp.]
MSSHDIPGHWIGASLLRKEDKRHLLGASTFVGDVRIPGMQDVAFVRSHLAHANVVGITKPEGFESKVYTLADLGELNHLDSGPELASFRVVKFPALAGDRVRYVGQPVAACVARTRAEAEDLAALVVFEGDILPAVIDTRDAIKPGTTPLFDGWPDNAFIHATVSEGDIASVADAPVILRRQFKMNRQSVAPLETRGIIAHWDHRLDELVIYMSTQGPHLMRHSLAQTLGLPEHKVRVIAPDVGGGFGGKNRLMPEDIAVCAIALKCGHPVRWIEDRREHLIAAVQAREHVYDMMLYAERNGRVLGIKGEVFVDAGAYSLWPSGPYMEASMAARNLPGP